MPDLSWRFLTIAAASLTGVAVAAAASPQSGEAAVLAALKTRLPKTPISKVDCSKAQGLCEVTAGNNLFYTDPRGRMLLIGRLYDMETRQDLTAARLLEINPDLLIGGAAAAQRAEAQEGSGQGPLGEGGAGRAQSLDTHAVRQKPHGEVGSMRRVSLAGLPATGAIVWGPSAGPVVTVFSDFRCSYCRALSNALDGAGVRVIERPISVLGTREIANRVYCAKDRPRALRAAYAGEELPAVSCDTSGLDANERFARANGFTGTPVIVRADGAVIEGYRPREFLINWLKGPNS